MNVFAWVLLAALAVTVAASWRLAAGGRTGELPLTRLVFAVVLAALAWLLRADTVDYGRWILLGVLLGVPSGLRFSKASRSWRHVGTVAFLLARLAYLVAVASLPPGDGTVPLGMLLVAGVVLVLVVAASRAGVGGLPLLGYAVVVALPSLAAWRSGHVVVGWAATALCAADLLGWQARVPGRRRALSEALADVASVLLVLGALRV